MFGSNRYFCDTKKQTMCQIEQGVHLKRREGGGTLDDE
jgi:hypothetical protein